MITYGSVCSGIESASVALEPLGCKPTWFSEIEPFPSAVLAHHWPNVNNYGDMLNIRHMLDYDLIDAPDLLIGGTPCQAFSVAGLRGSLDDGRGQLTLEFIKIADSIDGKRRREGKTEGVVWWENVPGVLSTKDNAFGCFLAGLAGVDFELFPTDEPKPADGKSTKHWRWDGKTKRHYPRWSSVGYVLGPERSVAWRVLDAQYFGVAQRRRRVFVVASARDGFDSRAVLFESEGVRRDTPPSRSPKQDVTGTVTARANAPDRTGQYDSLIPCMAHGQGGAEIRHNQAPTLSAGSDRSGNQAKSVLHQGHVRRLIPVECERLQGFDDNHTRIPYRNKPAEQCPDGPRYKAIGNSKAVPVVRWIGVRIILEWFK